MIAFSCNCWHYLSPRESQLGEAMQAEYERVATLASAEDMVREVVGGEI
jgi:hypothetical protein